MTFGRSIEAAGLRESLRRTYSGLDGFNYPDVPMNGQGHAGHRLQEGGHEEESEIGIHTEDDLCK